MLELYHYGMPRRSGRYPWGSGERPYQSDEKRSITESHSQKDRDQNTNKTKTANVFQKKMMDIDVQMLNKGLKKLDKSRELVGALHLHERDAQWEEVEKRTFNDGRYDYFNPAQVVKDFERLNKNPYPLPRKEGFNETIKAINPEYGRNGTTMNCTKCTASYELRRRGYNVQAGRQTYPAYGDTLMDWFDGTEKYEYDGYDSIEDHINNDLFSTINSDTGNLFRSGGVTVRFKEGDIGHQMHWTQSGDNFYIEDAQNGNSFNSFNDMMDFYKVDKSKGITIHGLTKAKPNWDNLGEDSVFRPSSNIATLKVRNRNNGRIVDTW